MAIGHDLLNVPMGEMIREMAFAVADAQQELDESSLRVAEMMSGARALRDEEGRLVDRAGNAVASPVIEDTRVDFGWETGAAGERTPSRASLIELGFTPTFYQFVDTVIEVKVAITMTRETETTTAGRGAAAVAAVAAAAAREGRAGGRTGRRRGALFGGRPGARPLVTATPVDASYAARYGYAAEGASLLRTKLVPVPPPAILEERIRALIDEQRAPARRAAGGNA